MALGIRRSTLENPSKPLRYSRKTSGDAALMGVGFGGGGFDQWQPTVYRQYWVTDYTDIKAKAYKHLRVANWLPIRWFPLPWWCFEHNHNHNCHVMSQDVSRYASLRSVPTATFQSLVVALVLYPDLTIRKQRADRSSDSPGTSPPVSAEGSRTVDL